MQEAIAGFRWRYDVHIGRDVDRRTGGRKVEAGVLPDSCAVRRDACGWSGDAHAAAAADASGETLRIGAAGSSIDHSGAGVLVNVEVVGQITRRIEIDDKALRLRHHQ